MNRANTARTAVNTTDVTTATYVDAAQQGKNQWWHYLLGLVVILVAFLIVGTAASVGVAFALFVPLALVFTAIQTTSEELFYRGYIVQGASHI